MAIGGLFLAPYEVVVALSFTVFENWVWLDGYYSGRDVDILHKDASRMFNIVEYWMVADNMQEEHLSKAQKTMRTNIEEQTYLSSSKYAISERVDKMMEVDLPLDAVDFVDGASYILSKANLRDNVKDAPMAVGIDSGFLGDMI